MGSDTSGKRAYQKLKPYIVLQILQRETDENHVLSAVEIAAALDELGIDAERRSIYRDIEEINIVNWLLENEGSPIQEAKEALAADKYDAKKVIVYDSSRKGFYVCKRRYGFQQIRLLAESVYTAKFLSEKEADAEKARGTVLLSALVCYSDVCADGASDVAALPQSDVMCSAFHARSALHLRSKHHARSAHHVPRKRNTSFKKRLLSFDKRRFLWWSCHH